MKLQLQLTETSCFETDILFRLFAATTITRILKAYYFTVVVQFGHLHGHKVVQLFKGKPNDSCN